MKSTTAEGHTPRRAKLRPTKNWNPSLALPSSNGFANRARELRMSLDIPTPTTNVTPNRPENGGKDVYFAQLAGMDMTPRRIYRPSPSPMKSILLNDMQSYAPAFQSEGSLARHDDFSNRTRGTPPRNTGNTPGRSSFPEKFSPPLLSNPPAPDPKENDFIIQVENCYNNLVSARDAIMALENEVLSLKKTVEEKDECISSLEQKFKSFGTTIAQNRDGVRKIEEEMATERRALSKIHAEELQKMRSECDGYKKHVREVDKLSAERYAVAKEIEREKEKSKGSMQGKDNMVGSLRNEIQRLNEELADGAVVRSHASKAEEAIKKLEAELDKSKTNHASATKLVVDLEMRLKEKTSEFDKALIGKDKAIATLESKLIESKSMKQSSERMKDKVCSLESQLDESNRRNSGLSGKVKDLQKRLALAERESSMKEKAIKQLETWSKSREMDFKRQLEIEEKKLQRQREILDKYVNDSDVEQETATALERAIEDLEIAHNESNSELIRLQKENQSLAAMLTEAEECMKIFRNKMNEYAEPKPMIAELQDVNSDLAHQLQKEEDQMKDSNKRITSIGMEAEPKSVFSKRKQGNLFRLQATKCDSQEQEEDANKKPIELTTLFEENKTELEKLGTNKGKMLRTIAKLERELNELRNESKSRAVNTKLGQDQSQKFQKESKKARMRVGAMEENFEELQHKLSVTERRTDDSPRIEELTRELVSVKEKLAERDEQLTDSEKGIAEAQKMIFRLMNIVQEMRKKAKQSE